MKIADAVAQGEGPRLDFKRDLSSLKSVLKDIVAFANTAGGVVVIGLDDDGSAVGVADPLREEERLSSSISDGIEPQLLPDIYAASYGEHELLGGRGRAPPGAVSSPGGGSRAWGVRTAWLDQQAG